MGSRGRNADVTDPDFWHKSPVEGLNRDEYNFLLGKFRWTEPQSPWRSERTTRAAWKKHRTALMAQCPMGTRPIAFWYFEKKLRDEALPWLCQEEKQYRAVLRHRCWSDEPEREFCRDTLLALSREPL